MTDLTADEMAFFATGELPPDLAAQHAVATPVIVPVVDPVIAPVVVPDPAIPDASELLRRSLAEEQNRRAQAEVRLQQIQQELATKTNPPAPAPDAATDPLGAMMHQLQQVNATVQDLQNKLATEQQNATLKSQFAEFTNSVRGIKEAYEKTVPDFNDAYQHIRTTRAEDLRMTGVPEAQINQMLLQDELNIAQVALQNGKNPAAEIYNMAKRYGYTPKAVPVGTPAAKIDAILKGQAAATNPSAGAPPASEITLDSLKNMSNNDLTKVVMNDDNWAKIVGGKAADIF